MRNIVRAKPTTEEDVAAKTDVSFARRYAAELIAAIDSVLDR